MKEVFVKRSSFEDTLLRWTILMRFCLIDGFLLYLRCVTEVITSLNNPNPRCANCGIYLFIINFHLFYSLPPKVVNVQPQS